ncbi:MAG: hypothetical protein Q4B26_12725, partial [Eubacteriales bacterium]|nr:hypothetical protein [Eubacteriales bacterium]
TLENADIQYAMGCFNKVIDECTDEETVNFAKVGKHVIISNLNDKTLEQDTGEDPISFLSLMPRYMRFADPNWEK